MHRALDQDPRKRPDARGLRDALIAALRPEEDEEPSREHRVLPVPRVEPLRRAGTAALAGVSLVWLLTAFPVYPPSWTIPIALVIGLLAWRSPFAAGCALTAVAVPALWNQAEASALLVIPAAALWLRAGRGWSGRVLAPLAAVPLAMIGLGPAIVLVAATAPTPRRRFAEGAAGGILAVVAGGTMPHSATRALAGATDPLAPLGALLTTPAVLAIVLACAVLAPLYPVAAERTDGHRGRALALWITAFAATTVALPQLLSATPAAPAPAAAAAAVVAILAAAWALVAPRISLGS